MARYYFSILLIWLLSGCTAINMHKPPPADWPKLKVSIHDMSFLDTQKTCGGNLILQYAACANINFIDMSCNIYTATLDVYVIEHEEAHCDGYDHYGSTELSDLWANYKKLKGLSNE